MNLSGSKGSCWVWGIVVLFLLALVGAIALYYAARMSMVNQVRGQMTQEEFAEMETWLDRTVKFPEEWANPEPYSETLKQTVEEIRPDIEYWMNPDEKIKGQLKSPRDPLIVKLSEGEELSEEEWGRVRELQTEARPLLEAISRFVAAPDYEVEAFALLDYENESNPLKQDVNHELFILIAYRIALEGTILATEREWDEAFQKSAFLFQLGSRHPGSDIISHVVGTSIDLIYSQTVQYIAARCDNAGVLRSTLEKMNAIQTAFPRSFVDSPFSLDNISYLRKAKRFGQVVDLRSGQPNSFYLDQFAEILVSKENSDTGSSGWDRYSLMVTPIEFLYYMGKRNYDNAASRFETGTAALRLAKIGVAKRIRELEENEDVYTLEDLAPDLLPTMLEDPFSGKAFLWDASSEYFYSVGPDMKDNQNLIPYSPTNGVVSTGDYSLR